MKFWYMLQHDELQKHNAKWKNPDTRGLHTGMIPSICNATSQSAEQNMDQSWLGVGATVTENGHESYSEGDGNCTEIR